MNKYSEELLEIAQEYEMTVEEFIVSSQENDMEYIASLVKDGYTSGYYPTWSTTVERDEERLEEQFNYISHLIGQGFTSGYYPTWQLKVAKWSYESYL